ncbi:MAG TPA: hypothetical protein PK357_02995 [Candidatus Pacearchaeota archaeon]|nr:hypothetical protein [Candidatus Pacearchaeota archaeon]
MELIRNYINYPKSGVGIQLSNRIIKGEDLVSALDNLRFETDKEIDEYIKIKADYEELTKEYEKLEAEYKELEKNRKELISKLELLIKDSITNKIKQIISDSEENNPQL